MKPAFTRSVREELLSALYLIAAILAHMNKDLIWAEWVCIIKFIECVAMSLYFAIKDD